MEDDTTLGADLAAAMGDTSTQTAADSSVATVDPPAQPGAATTEPAAGATEIPGTEKATGPIPFDVHKTALDNARTKAVAEKEAEWEQQYGCAKQINRDDLLEFAEKVQQSKSDPIAFLQAQIAELQADPTYAAQLRSMAAKALGQRQQESTGPLPVIELADGQMVDLNALKAQWTQEQDAKYAPALAAAQKLQHAENLTQADQFATALTGELQLLPGYEANKVAIGADVLKQIQQLPRNDPRGDNPAWLEAAAFRAYHRVGLPKLQTAERQTVLNDIHQKATVNTVNPNQQSAGTPKNYSEMSWAEAFQYELAAKR